MAALSYGSKGSEVTSLQKLLNSKGYSLTVDGVYGDNTLSAVKDYQTKNGLTVDGIAGEKTLASLDGTTSAPSSVTTADVEALYNQLNTTTETPAETTDGTTTETVISATSTPGDTTRVKEAMDALKGNEQLSKLLNELNTSTYTPMTTEQIKAQAEREYQTYYDTLRQSARQNAETQNLALQQQKEGLQETYDTQREKSAKQYRQAYSQADRQTLARGMQRSSYAGQTLANIDIEAAEAQQELYNAQAGAENQISTQQTLLAAQLADQISQYDANQAADILTRIDELEAREYDRSTTAANNQNTLTMQIYSILNDQLQKQVEHEQWLAEFNESVRQFEISRGMSSGGGGGYYGGGYSGGYSSNYKKNYSSGYSSSSTRNTASASGSFASDDKVLDAVKRINSIAQSITPSASTPTHNVVIKKGVIGTVGGTDRGTNARVTR